MPQAAGQLSPETGAQTLAEVLRERVQSLEPGDFFGTEADIAREHAVSHSVAREAVMQLKSLGILESRKRKGLIVRRPDPLQLLAQSLPMLADSQEDMAELARLRYVLEIGAIEFAVINASDEQIDRLQSLADELEKVGRAGDAIEEEGRLEFAFHVLILEMSGSRLIAGMQRVLARFFDHMTSHTGPHDPTQQTIWQHHALVNAIRNRDLDTARAIMRLHFKSIMDAEYQSPEKAVTK